MAKNGSRNPMEVLLVENNPDNVRLTREAVKEGKLHLQLNAERNSVI